MRTKKSLKVLVLALAVVMVFGVMTTSFAFFDEYTNKVVRGGSSQILAYGDRSLSYAARFTLERAYATGNPGMWRMRAYNQNKEISKLYDIDRGGLHEIVYQEKPYTVDMYHSVVSSYSSDYFVFDASLYM